MLALKRWRCTPLHSSRHARRQAHTATAPEVNQAGPSNYYRRSDPASNSDTATTDTGKGKSRSKTTPTSTPISRDEGTSGSSSGGKDEYRFPVKGRKGGEPDPFEVMALDRTASPSEVKKQCKLPLSLEARHTEWKADDLVDYRLALLLHPDSSHPSSSPEHFASLHRAYTLLSSPAKRSSYVQTGYGWDSASSPSGGRRSNHSYEDQMRAEIRYRAQGGTSGWHGRGRPTYGHSFRESEAGRGAWGGFRGGDGKYEAYDTGEFSQSQGTGEERYMSNTQFLGLIAGIVSSPPTLSPLATVSSSSVLMKCRA